MYPGELQCVLYKGKYYYQDNNRNFTFSLKYMQIYAWSRDQKHNVMNVSLTVQTFIPTPQIP